MADSRNRPRRTIGVNDSTLARLRDLAYVEETTLAEVIRRLVREAHAKLSTRGEPDVGRSK